jgi:hypothetical protein
MYLGPDKGAPNFKTEAEGADPKRMAKVAEMPCVICYEYNMVQLSRTTVHHCIHGRNGYRKRAKNKRRAPDSMTIPLCDGHHQGDFDTSKIALHRQPYEWVKQYGKDVDWISWVEERL